MCIYILETRTTWRHWETCSRAPTTDFRLASRSVCNDDHIAPEPSALQPTLLICSGSNSRSTTSIFWLRYLLLHVKTLNGMLLVRRRGSRKRRVPSNSLNQKEKRKNLHCILHGLNDSLSTFMMWRNALYVVIWGLLVKTKQL